MGTASSDCLSRQIRVLHPKSLNLSGCTQKNEEPSPVPSRPYLLIPTSLFDRRDHLSVKRAALVRRREWRGQAGPPGGNSARRGGGGGALCFFFKKGGGGVGGGGRGAGARKGGEVWGSGAREPGRG